MTTICLFVCEARLRSVATMENAVEKAINQLEEIRKLIGRTLRKLKGK